MSNILNKSCFHSPQYATTFRKFYFVLVVWSLIQPRQCAQVPQNLPHCSSKKTHCPLQRPHLFMLFVLRIIQTLHTFWV